MIFQSIRTFNQEKFEKCLAEKGKAVFTMKNRSGDTPLLFCAHMGFNYGVVRLLQMGADVNERGVDGETALMKAFETKNHRLAVLLISNGADISLRGNNEQTVLHYAAKSGMPRVMIEEMIKKGLDVNEKDREELTPLILASIYGHIEVAKCLIQNGADIDLYDHRGQTALHHAIFCVHTAVAEFLVQNGADVTKADCNGWTPLKMGRTIFGSDDWEYILKNRPTTQQKASVQPQNTGVMVHPFHLDEQDENGQTFLIKAVLKGEKEVVSRLLREGVDALIKDKEGVDAYNYAMRGGNLEMARMIQEAVKEGLLKRKVTSQRVGMAQNSGRQNGI